MAPSLRALVSLLACLVLFGTSEADEAAEAREAQMKAAYVFNFIKFVEWPVRPDMDVIQICFSGAPSVRDALSKATADKEVGGRRILVRSHDGNAPAEQCQVLYIDSESAAKQGSPPAAPLALTIGDAENFTREGGVIQLYTERNRLRFVINMDNAKRAGLQVSSHLLKLATGVEQEPAR